MQKKLQWYQKQILKKLRPILNFMDAMNQKNVTIIAAGIAYYALLAIFPAMAAGMAIALFVLEPGQVQGLMLDLRNYIPAEIADMLSAVLGRQAGESSNLWAAALGIGLALFGASGAMENMTKALNAVFDTEETRNPVELKLISIAMTVGTILLAGVVGGMLLLTVDQLVAWGVPAWVAIVLSVVRWVFIVLLINAALFVLFRYGANRKRADWQFTTPGVATATGVWLAVTVAFVMYMKYSPGLAQSYSIFAGIIALMMWFNLTAMALLVGALVDARRR